ncbi:MAG: MBL fold metallo-hydrolase [Aquabacterium sp.]|nr:MAG: MBL fold metallo-hydrolase [Aquabacterium sp.]
MNAPALADASIAYPYGQDQPPPGTARDLVPGIRWVRMGLPFQLNHINLWLLRDEIGGRAGWTVVDCGLGNDTTQQAWEQVFATALDGLPVLRVVVTHLHPDHIGCAAWMAERWSTPEAPCRVWISAGEYYGAQLALQNNNGNGGERAAAFLATHGLTDTGAHDGVRKRSGYYSMLVPGLPAQHARLIGGQALRIGGEDWHCLAGYGHSPEHIALHCPARGVLISGDMLLPRISTNVSVAEYEPEGDPLGLYLASLDRLRALPADTLVLPSHGFPFHGAHARIDALHAHHADRLEVVMQACRERPQHAAELLEPLFHRKLDLHQTTFAMGEAVAHLNYLWLRGRLAREKDARGVWMFSAPD